MRNIQSQYTSSAGRGGGFAVVENLVAMLLLMIVLTGATRLFISSFHFNAGQRADASLLADVMAEVDEYRDQPYRDFVYSIWQPGSEVPDGNTVTFDRKGVGSRSTVRTSFTAQSTTAALLPEAVHVRIEVEQRSGPLRVSTSSFETVIAYAE